MDDSRPIVSDDDDGPASWRELYDSLTPIERIRLALLGALCVLGLVIVGAAVLIAVAIGSE